MKKYVVSGLPPGTSGLGRFLASLSLAARDHGWKVLWRPQRGDGNKVLFALKVAWFYTRLRFLRNTEVLTLHPQTLRWRTFFRLMASNRMRLYLVDNSFFCIRSYNYRESGWQECLDCLGDLSRCHPSCRPFPVSLRRSDNLAYLDRLKVKAPAISFFVQNPSQGRLVRKHFGENAEIRLGGMMTSEFKEVERGRQGSGIYDVVFHGALNAAKGAVYAIELARHLPELSFLLPGKYEEARKLSGDAGLPDNVKVREITWETGLREHIETCRLVLCPSLWSAPIEGALVKSLLHNGRVAVYDSLFGYQSDLPAGLVIRIGPDLEEAARCVREEMGSPVDLELVSSWFEEFRSRTDLDSAFR